MIKTSSLPGCAALVSSNVGGHGTPVGIHLSTSTDGPVDRVSDGSGDRRGLALGTGKGGLAVDLKRERGSKGAGGGGVE